MFTHAITILSLFTYSVCDEKVKTICFKYLKYLRYFEEFIIRLECLLFIFGVFELLILEFRSSKIKVF